MKAAGWLLVNTVQALFLAVWSVIWMTTSYIVRIFSRELPVAISRACWSPALLGITGARVVVLPAEAPIDRSRPHIFMMNHQSLLDIPLVMASIPVNLRFIAKSSLRWVPFLGWYMAATGMCFIDRRRHADALKSLDRAVRRLGRGESLFAFPEGTRSRDGRIGPFKKGVFVAAIQAGASIIPVASDGTGRVLPPDGFAIRPGEIRLRIGRSIDAAQYRLDQRDDLMRAVRAAMIEMHGGLGGAGGVADDATLAAVPSGQASAT